MMRQSLITQGKISKLQTRLSMKMEGSVEDIDTEILEAMRELHRYIQLVEQKLEEVETTANRPRFY